MEQHDHPNERRDATGPDPITHTLFEQHSNALLSATAFDLLLVFGINVTPDDADSPESEGYTIEGYATGATSATFDIQEEDARSRMAGHMIELILEKLTRDYLDDEYRFAVVRNDGTVFDLVNKDPSEA